MHAVIEWRAVDKSILGALIFLAFTMLYWMVEYFVLGHPDVAPYINRTFLPTAFAVQTGMLGAWAAFIAVCLVVKRLGWEARRLVYTLMILCAIEILYGSYFFGLLTNPFFGVATLAALATGYVWYGRLSMTVTTAVTIAAVVALDVAEALHVVPEAPLFSQIPLRDGVLPISYVVSFSGLTFVMLVALVPWVAFIVSEFHERGDRLAEANDIISRYVASQLAEQIKKGNHDQLDHARSPQAHALLLRHPELRRHRGWSGARRPVLGAERVPVRDDRNRACTTGPPSTSSWVTRS